MSLKFEELDFQSTPWGDISLRRRMEPRLDGKVIYEVKLGDEFLMSSLFTHAEIQLATLALTQLTGDELNIVVGGLGLGYTAQAALNDNRVSQLQVIDVMQPVIDWHNQGLVPIGSCLADDARCSLVQADFFKLAAMADCGFNLVTPDELADAVLLDIDHTPRHWLNNSNQQFYSASGLTTLASKIQNGGIFGLWSDDEPDEDFMSLLKSVFDDCQAHYVSFDNPYTLKQSANTVYLARVK